MAILLQADMSFAEFEGLDNKSVDAAGILLSIFGSHRNIFGDFRKLSPPKIRFFFLHFKPKKGESSANMPTSKACRDYKYFRFRDYPKNNNARN